MWGIELTSALSIELCSNWPRFYNWFSILLERVRGMNVKDARMEFSAFDYALA